MSTNLPRTTKSKSESGIGGAERKRVWQHGSPCFLGTLPGYLPPRHVHFRSSPDPSPRVNAARDFTYRSQIEVIKKRTLRKQLLGSSCQEGKLSLDKYLLITCGKDFFWDTRFFISKGDSMLVASHPKLLLLIPHLGGGGAKQFVPLRARGLQQEKYQLPRGLMTQADPGTEELP